MVLVTTEHAAALDLEDVRPVAVAHVESERLEVCAFRRVRNPRKALAIDIDVVDPVLFYGRQQGPNFCHLCHLSPFKLVA